MKKEMKENNKKRINSIIPGKKKPVDPTKYDLSPVSDKDKTDFITFLMKQHFLKKTVSFSCKYATGAFDFKGVIDAIRIFKEGCDVTLLTGQKTTFLWDKLNRQRDLTNPYDNGSKYWCFRKNEDFYFISIY